MRIPYAQYLERYPVTYWDDRTLILQDGHSTWTQGAVHVVPGTWLGIWRPSWLQQRPRQRRRLSWLSSWRSGTTRHRSTGLTMVGQALSLS